MIARFTRIMLALQLIVIAGLASLLFKLHWINQPLLAIAASALLLTLPRAAVVINNFFLTDALRQPLQNGTLPSLLARARLLLTEFYASSLCWYWLLPFAVFRSRLQPHDSGLPVLLIHGYGANSGYWKPCSKLLTRAGISHQAIELEPVLASIDDYAELINTAVEALCASSGQQQVIILAHSMGGLAARAFVRVHGSERVAKLITLGTPHFGSTLANFAMGVNATQMQRAAPAWLHALADTETPALRACVVSIYSRQDNIVAPQDSAHLPGASNVAVELIGHVALGFDAGVLKLVLNEITAARQSRS
jgi:pimeloyl-ACP methyl ester carboxylesterase